MVICDSDDHYTFFSSIRVIKMICSEAATDNTILRIDYKAPPGNLQNYLTIISTLVHECW